ncbi:MAG TPA: hypothetical protein VNQ80_15455 [Parapedobacter sp.]|uniref:hypothetical protein n=1 Tax=Parapedobacter sp. TaxID=1958893 RepID=UPI002CE6D2F3|nr:hypothetical protein [Parapedobacter sp.]HWK58739.1 hypothetical protein [Parapedobacter sp.]
MKRLLFVAVVLLLLGSTSNRVRERRTIGVAARELGISVDSLERKVMELEALTSQLAEVE